MGWFGNCLESGCCDLCDPNEIDSYTDTFSGTFGSPWNIIPDSTAANSGGVLEVGFFSSFSTNCAAFLETNPDEDWASLSIEVDLVETPPANFSFYMDYILALPVSARLTAGNSGGTLTYQAATTTLTPTPANGDTLKIEVTKTGLDVDVDFFINGGTSEHTESGTFANAASANVCGGEIYIGATRTTIGATSVKAKFDNYDHAFVY